MRIRFLLLVLTSLLLAAGSARAASAETARSIYEQAPKSLAIVQFTFDSPEQRLEVEGLGLVVDEGLVMLPIEFVNTSFPDQYLTRFKLIRPARGDEPEREYDATFAGRDERSGVAFVRYGNDPTTPPTTPPTTLPAEGEDDLPPPDWEPVTFSFEEPGIGETVYSVGRMPEEFGYTPYVTTSRISAPVRGPTPMIFTAGDGLTTVGSPVFNADGEAVGYVIQQQGISPATVFINSEGGDMRIMSLAPPRMFLPADFLRVSLEDPPAAGEPVRVPDVGLRQLEGLSKDLREFFELGNTPAVQVGEVVPGSAAEEAGVTTGEVIVALNGEPLERGDLPDELPDILGRKLSRMPVGETVSMTLLNAAGERRDVDVMLRERPEQSSSVRREYFEDLGFSVRPTVFNDLYARKLEEDAPGILVEFVRPNAAAQSANLRPGDLIRQLNQTPIEDLAQFETAYTEFRDESPEEAVVLEVLRSGDTQVIRIEPPRD
jgi:S1-C subfamily serine protease